MTTIQINGQRFETATEWTIDEIQLGFTDTPDVGSPTYIWLACDPSGPNAGSTSPQVTIDAWTDTQIVFSFDAADAAPYTHLTSVLYRDVTDTNQLVFDVNPDQPFENNTPDVVTVASPLFNNFELELNGTNLDLAERWRVIDDFTFDSFYYDSAGPNAGLNPPGATVAVSAAQVTIMDPALEGITVTYIQTRANGDAVVDEWFGSVAVNGASQPEVTSVVQSGADEIIVFGEHFLDSTGGLVANLTVTGSFGSLTTCLGTHTGYPACVPPGTGLGGPGNNDITISHPDFVLATITSVTIEDEDADYSVSFDIDPDLVMT